MDYVVYLITMLVCLLLSAYFSASETAFLEMNKARLRTMADKGSRGAELALKLSENENALLSTVMLGNKIVNILLTAMGTLLFVSLLGEGVGAAISILIATVAILIFGEIFPEALAKSFPEKFAILSSPIIRVFGWILLPFNAFFGLWKLLLNKLFKSRTDEKMSQEELLMLVDEVEQEGSIDGEEGSLIRNVIELRDLTAEEILTHRVNLVGFEADTPKEEIAALFAESKFSRLLVYEEDIDHIIGVLHQKDFYSAQGVTDREIRDILSPPLFIPQTEHIGDLLRLFQINQSHLAVVVDEYGETYGIVTMEDILEELVGEIWDEHDEVVESFRNIGENIYEVSCDVNPEEFGEFFKVEPNTECSTLNGWIAEQLAKIPETDDVFSYEHLTVKVVEVDSHRATYANITVHPPKVSEKSDDGADGE